MIRRCPDHVDHGITPYDDFCHDHEGDAQQILHSKHCEEIGCPFASSGIDRKGNVPVHPPRNEVERLLAGNIARALVRLVLLW